MFARDHQWCLCFNQSQLRYHVQRLQWADQLPQLEDFDVWHFWKVIQEYSWISNLVCSCRLCRRQNKHAIGRVGSLGLVTPYRFEVTLSWHWPCTQTLLCFIVRSFLCLGPPFDFRKLEIPFHGQMVRMYRSRSFGAMLLSLSLAFVSRSVFLNFGGLPPIPSACDVSGGPQLKDRVVKGPNTAANEVPDELSWTRCLKLRWIHLFFMEVVKKWLVGHIINTSKSTNVGKDIGFLLGELRGSHFKVSNCFGGIGTWIWGEYGQQYNTTGIVRNYVISPDLILNKLCGII